LFAVSNAGRLTAPVTIATATTNTRRRIVNVANVAALVIVTGAVSAATRVKHPRQLELTNVSNTHFTC